jgi:hypothetical protein
MDNNWFKIWPSKMRSLVSSLPTGRMRADMTLLIMTYLDDGGLPDSDTKLAFLTGLPIEDIQALRPYFEFLGRCEGGRLYLDFAEDVIMERVEFAEKKANAAAKRWDGKTKEPVPSKAMQPPPDDSDAQPKKAQKSTAKQRKAQQSTAMPDKQTDIQTCTDSSNELSGAGALPEPPPEPEKLPEPEVSNPGRKPDPLFNEFCSLFQSAHAGEPYAYKPADFVKLAGLRDRYAKAQPAPWEVTVERFRQAAEHYFGSDLATHTLADLCERFSTFFRQPVDRWNKPITSSNGGFNGKSETSKSGKHGADQSGAHRTTEQDGIRSPREI